MIHTEARSIREIDEKRWDSVAGRVLPMSHRWLRLMERYWHPYGSRYLLFEDRQGPCAAAVANTATASGNLGLPGRLFERLTLDVSPPFSSMCGVMVRPGASLDAFLPQLEPALRQIGRREKRLLLRVENVGAPDLPAWRQAGFMALQRPGLNVLDLPATYDLYLDTLRPKDRSELRRIHKRAGELNVHVEIGPLANDSEQIYALLCEVFANHGTALQAMPFTSQFLTGLEREMPGDVQFVRGYVGEELAGVFLCLSDGPGLWWPMAGLRYEIARPSYLYFVLMDEMIRWSIQQGIQRIYGGQTNNQEKQSHGFHLEQRWFCYRACVQPMNQILRLALPIAQRLRQQVTKTL